MGGQARKKAQRRRERELAQQNNPLQHSMPYAAASHIFGRAMPAQFVIDELAKYGWRESFFRLGFLGSAIANDPQGPGSARIRHLTIGALASISPPPDVDGATLATAIAVRDWARTVPSSVALAHEEVISYLQHLVVLYGAPEGPAPTDAALALWILAAADYLDYWYESGAKSPSDTLPPGLDRQTAELIATQARLSRFNNSGDILRAIVRTHAILKDRPKHGRLSDPATWKAVQERAFKGLEFSAHFECRLMPLYILSNGWGIPGRQRNIPTVNFDEWKQWGGAVGPGLVEWVSSQASSRDELQRAIRRRMRPDGLLPHSPTALLHSPFVRLSDDVVGVPSAWSMRSHIHTGSWAAVRGAVESTLGKGKSVEWLYAFGALFEEWLRHVAGLAKASPSIRGRFELSEGVGTSDEIEDVVLVDGPSTILFSAKSRLMKESVARHATSPRAVIDWYEEFLFADRAGDQRGGAVRLLDAHVMKARAGEYEPSVSRDALLVPVIVTFDPLGEEFLLYNWIQKRCVELGLLQQEGVSDLAIASVSDFERLMALAANGESLHDFFRARRTPPWKGRRLDHQLLHAAPKQSFVELSEYFEALADRMKSRFVSTS